MGHMILLDLTGRRFFVEEREVRQQGFSARKELSLGPARR